MPAFELDILDSAGNIKGFGPIRSAQSVDDEAQLDRAGPMSFEAPRADPHTETIQDRRLMRWSALRGGRWQALATGIIETQTEDLQADQTLMIDVGGFNRLIGLADRTVGSLALNNDAGGHNDQPMPKASVLAAIMAYAPTGWTVVGTPSEDVYLAFSGETVLAALGKVAEQTGDHFRFDDDPLLGKVLRWLPKTTLPVTSGVRAIGNTTNSQHLLANTGVCLITRLSRKRDSSKRVTRVYAYGSGNEKARLTLQGATYSLPAGYSYGNDTIGGVTRYFIKHDAYDAAGRIDEEQTFEDKAVQGSGGSHGVSAANALAQTAVTWLQRHVEVYYSYDLDVAKVDRDIPVGTTIRVVYDKILNGRRLFSLDRDILVLGVKRRADSTGATWISGLTLASSDRWPEDDESAIIGTGVQSQTQSSHLQQAAQVQGLEVTGATSGTVLKVAPAGAADGQLLAFSASGDQFEPADLPDIGGVVTTDPRLSDARVPLAHANSHAAAGSDPLTLSESQITNLTSDLASKAPLASPALTGTPTAPTAATATNTAQLATTAFVQANAALLQPLDSDLTAIAALSTTSFGRALLALADAAALRTAGGLGSLAVLSAVTASLISDASANGRSLITAADYAAMRSLLGLVLGTNVQAWDTDLDALAGLTYAADTAPYFTAAHAAALMTVTSFARTLLDDTDAATMRATLGVYNSLVRSNGTDQTQRTAVNFVGFGFRNVDDSTNNESEVHIQDPAGSCVIFDDFFGNNATSGQIGQMGWTFGGFATLGSVNGGSNHPGCMRLTGPAAATVCYLQSNEAAAGGFNSLNPWDLVFIVRPAGTGLITGGDWRFGFLTTPATAATGGNLTNGIFAEFRNGDANWQMVYRTGNAESTRQNTAVAVPAANTFVKLRLRMISATSIGLTVDTNTEQTMTIPSITGANVLPCIQVVSTDGAAKGCDVDYVLLAMHGISR